MWGRPAVIGVLAVLAAPCLGSEVQPLQFGSWEGGAYADDAAGAFSHCSAGAAFGKVFVYFSMTRDGGLSVALADPAWRVTAGEAIPIDLAVDPGGPLRLAGVAGVSNTVFARLPDSDVAALEYRSTAQMHAVLLGSRYDFDLTSPSELLSWLKDCVARNVRAASAPAPDHPPTPAAPEAPARFGPPAGPGVALAMSGRLPVLPAPPSQPSSGPARGYVDKSAPSATSAAPGESTLSQVSKLTRTLDSTGAAPNFVPWPPPMPTAKYRYPPEWVHKHRTIGELSADLEELLTKSGYTQFSYTLVPNGFALATQFERIDQIDTPKTDITRFAPLEAYVPQSWMDMLKSVIVGRQGRCRLFVFFLTTDNQGPSAQRATEDEGRIWSLGGQPTLPNGLANVLLKSAHIFYVYEYEFVREPSNTISEVGSSFLPLDQQLRTVKLLP